ncbi:MAG: hypothetical protein HOW73_28350 [Polyangiaceae bacterium]|nr:hypothetical protein [Polyangiaceae bacterium]
MGRVSRLSVVAVLLASAGAGCGDDTQPFLGEGGADGEPLGPTYVIDIVVDANRNGVADPADPADQDAEEQWDASVGAMFLPNLDDDDADQIRDADDTKMNGGNDALDIVAFRVSACPECSEGSTGKVELDDTAAANVRVFAHGLDGSTWSLVAGETGTCSEEDPTCTPVTAYSLSTEQVRAGAVLAIEGRDVIRQEGGWDGFVELAYSITDAEGTLLTTDANPDGVDRAKMRVAPWLLFGNLTDFDRVWSSSDSGVFVNGIEDATDAAKIEYERYSNYGDQWTQDFFQTGYFAIPIATQDGGVTVHGMRVANARPWGRSNSDASLPIRWLNKNYLGPDQATLAVYHEPHSGDSFDSHGNHDLIPAYSNGGDDYPLGRILIGSGILDETKAFYNAQGLQSPYYIAYTDWLLVGHVDEYLSFVPANTPRGWKLLIASPRMSREMLLEAQAAGNGAAIVHQGKQWYDWDTGGEIPAAISIDDLLANEDIMEASQDAQVTIDEEREKLQAEIGLTDDEIIEMPFLFGQEMYGATSYKIAYQPGTVNALVFGDYIVMAKPFGPQIDGDDIFEAHIREQLGTAMNDLGKDGQGLEVYFTDDWDLYHRLDGEVHCGTNPDASAPFSNVNWWETGR